MSFGINRLDQYMSIIHLMLWNYLIIFIKKNIEKPCELRSIFYLVLRLVNNRIHAKVYSIITQNCESYKMIQNLLYEVLS